MRHPVALFGQKAAVFLVAAPVLQIDLLVGDVDVTAQNELALALQCVQIRVNTAVRKLRFGARLMEAFMTEQMRRNGFGNRCFRFTEEFSYDSLSSQERGSVQRETVKVHIIRMDQTVAEIQDPNVAQQNSDADNPMGLFEWAADAIRQYIADNPHLESCKGETPKASSMFMDAHWDPNQDLI